MQARDVMTVNVISVSEELAALFWPAPSGHRGREFAGPSELTVVSA